MRLIDVDKVLERAIPVRGEYDNSLPFEAVPVGYIKGAPTVEVETIRHGQWVATGDANGFALWDSCSVCGYGLSAINSGKNYNFCPNCGAKMDKLEAEKGAKN